GRWDHLLNPRPTRGLPLENELPPEDELPPENELPPDPPHELYPGVWSIPHPRHYKEPLPLDPKTKETLRLVVLSSHSILPQRQVLSLLEGIRQWTITLPDSLQQTARKLMHDANDLPHFLERKVGSTKLSAWL